MDRVTKRTAPWMPWALLAPLAITVTGCAGVLATGAYLMGMNETPAECEELIGNKVIVVCRPSSQELRFSNKVAADEVAIQVSRLLKKNVRKIDVVEQRKVHNWTDENQWDEFTEVGKAASADMVVGIELDRFSLYEGQTLYRGKASYSLQVYDMANGGKVVFEKYPDPLHYPPNTSIHTQDRSETQFRRQFTATLADNIARHFYRFDPRNDFAADSTALYSEF